ncbi:winged helix-turn-helix transcriptional regulator [Nonomuraea sp. K274]|uniref:Winged helix-turn-helix transcriptional regulator n=1 Tax=Nonomuraea cypriaca TaxID=1187855 RepID=A0A931ADH4_9ACTN|nr:winged helix-turn-helix transcriptional regulator [Nonomuraea cypriaca]
MSRPTPALGSERSSEGGEQASVDRDGDAGEVGGARGGEEGDEFGGFLWPPGAAQGAARRWAHTANGLTPRQFHILGLLHDRGPLAQTDLAAETDAAASVLVTQLNPLEAEALVTRTRDPRDRRRHLVLLTEKGQRLLRTAAAAQQQVEDDLFRSLNESQRAQLTQLLVLVRDDLTEGNEHCGTPASLDRKTS